MRPLPLLALALLFALTACLPEPPLPTPTPPPAAELSTLRVGVDTDSQPFVYRDADQNLRGFDIDLIEELALAAGYKEVQFVATTIGEIEQGSFTSPISNSSYDVAISMISVTAQRDELVDFSVPYFEAALQVAVRGDAQAPGAPVELAGKRVGVQPGTTGEDRAVSLGADTRPYTDLREALRLLSAGELDAVLHDGPALAHLIAVEQLDGLSLLPPAADETPERYAIVVRPTRPDLLQQLNAGLNKVMADPAYDRLYRAWFGAEIPPAIAALRDGVAAATPVPAQAAAPAVVEVRVYYGSEKERWIAGAAEAFNSRNELVEGALVRVAATPYGSVEAADGIIAGTLEATVWMPASSLYIPVAADEWRAERGGELLAENAVPLALSPVVIAIWQPMADALRASGASLDWSTLAGYVGRPWVEIPGGSPDWNSFTLGHTDPTRSNSGLAAVLAMAYAGAEVPAERDLSLAELQAQVGFIDRIQQGITGYERSTGFFARAMLCSDEGPGALSAAVLYENLVATQREIAAECGKAHPPLVALYPNEGTFVIDNPYAILDAPWVTPAQQEGARRFRDFLLSPEQQQAALAAGFRPVAAAQVAAPLTPANGVDPNQPRRVLRSPSPEVIARAGEVWLAAKKPADVVAVLDLSGSMNAGSKLEDARSALAEFVEQLGDQDRLAVLVFSNDVRQLSALSEVATKRSMLSGEINVLAAEGATALYDATAAAQALLAQAGRPDAIRAVVVLTDGRDEKFGPDGQTVVPGGSSITQQQLLEQLAGGAVPTYTIAYGEGADQTALRAIAEATGGASFVATPDSVGQVYTEIALRF